VSGRAEFLPWLESPPADFRARLRSLDANDGAAVRRLAASAMNGDQLGRFGQFVNRNAAALASAGLTPLKLGIVGSHTTDFMADALAASGVRHGLLVNVVRADYGQVVQSVLGPDPALNGVDVVLLSLDAAALGLARTYLDTVDATAALDAAISQLRTLRNGIREVLGAVPVLQTLPLPADPLFGSFDARIAGTARSLTDAINRRMADEVIGQGDLLVDIAFAAASCGLGRWHDPRAWHSAKLPFSLDVVPIHADYVCRVLGAAKGKAKKCLVLDLDNTIWGGVIGDDGLEGIKIGQGNAAGEAYLAVQGLALELRQRGVILAVCSKNEDAAARSPFREHRDMLLKEEHIAVFTANWTDKAANLRDIAAQLDIGTDSLVFLDDNPAERSIIRRELPEVAVPEVGDDPSLYPGLISRAGYFEAISFAREDLLRADMYRANAERRTAAASVTNLAEYLVSLEMSLTANPFDAQGRTRIAQLINRSNQFNLTTRRYDEAAVAAFEEDPGKFTLQVRLIDKFGDNGMVSVIIFEKSPEIWSCDTWLMSCRVLGRRVEEAVLAIVAAAAIRDGASMLRGWYIPTAKNALVAEHFGRLGFRCTGRDDSGATEWELPLGAYVPPDLPMRIVPS
jgi:FkbH-like protein